MKVTIKQIAEVANVSRGTVDRALNDRHGINPQLAKEIVRIADEMGYTPNLAARSLSNAKLAKKIGVLLSSKDNPFFDDVIRGVTTAAENLESFGIEVKLVELKGFDAQAQLKYLQKFEGEGVSGVVLTPINTPKIAEKLKHMSENKTPIVAINTDIPDNLRLAYIGCDYVKSGRIAGGLISTTCTRTDEKLLVVIGSKLVLAQAQRLCGILEVLENDAKHIIVDGVIENDDRDDISYNLVREALAKNPDISIVCFAAAGVEGGLRAIEEFEHNDKIRVFTYDLTGVVKEHLETGRIIASICQQPYQQGYLGVDILGKYIITGAVPEQTVVSTEISIKTKYSL